MSEDQSRLPNIFGVAAAWAQFVALVPMLIMYDNSEVEIMNTDIPDYQGPVAFLGQALAIALVAIGSVKKIFSTNEFAIVERKRSLYDDPDIYFRVAEMLDRQQCVHLFVCTLSARAQNNASLTPEQIMFIGPFGRRPPDLSYNLSSALLSFQKASLLGKTQPGGSTCHQAYPLCPYSMDMMASGLRWVQKLRVKDLKMLTKFLRIATLRRAKRKPSKSQNNVNFV